MGAVGCGKKEAAPARPAPMVTVAQPSVGPVALFAVFTGATQAFETAEVVARVQGTLETVEFEASSFVKKDELLFTIEDERYLAARDVAKANVASAEADLLRSDSELRRVVQASKSKAVSEMDVDRARANKDMAIASVASAKAKLADAELDLSYTKVKAPFHGIVSRNLVDPGNLVGQMGSTELTRINRIQPIYVYFHAPETVVLKHLRSQGGKRPEGNDPERPNVEARVALANEEGFPHVGVIDFIDNQVNKDTGTIEMRVRLENENFLLFPGLFVRVKVLGETIANAVQIPEVAVGSDLGGKFVLVVGEGNVVEQVYVTLGAPQGDGNIHVAKGLDGKESVIVNGLMSARPGLPVQPFTAEEFKAMKQKMAQQKKPETKS